MNTNKINVRGYKTAILTMSFLQMASNALASVIAKIAENFPEVPVDRVQFLMTFPNLISVVFSVIFMIFSARISKKFMAVTGPVLGILAGILSFLFHSELAVLFIFAAFLGTGIALTVPVANSFITDRFTGREKDSMLGWQHGG